MIELATKQKNQLEKDIVDQFVKVVVQSTVKLNEQEEILRSLRQDVRRSKVLHYNTATIELSRIEVTFETITKRLLTNMVCDLITI